MSDLLSMCQHGTSKMTKLMKLPAHVNTCVDFLPAPSATTHEWLATPRLMKSRDAAGEPSEDKETEVKAGVRFPNETPFCKVSLVQIPNCAK